MMKIDRKKIITGNDILSTSAEIPSIPTGLIFLNLPTIIKTYVTLVGETNILLLFLSIFQKHSSSSLVVEFSTVVAKLTNFLLNISAIPVGVNLVSLFSF